MHVHLSFAFALVACTGGGSPTPITAEETQLESAREQFEQTGDNYSFHWSKSCYCGRETTDAMLITVENGVIASAFYVETEQPVPASVRAHLLTIDGIFDKIQDAIDDNAHAITVAYDVTLGYPTSVSFDYNAELADEELSLAISELKHSP